MILLLGLRNFSVSSKFSHSSYIKELLPAILNDYTPYVPITHGRLLKSLITFRNFIFRFFSNITGSIKQLYFQRGISDQLLLRWNIKKYRICLTINLTTSALKLTK